MKALELFGAWSLGFALAFGCVFYGDWKDKDIEAHAVYGKTPDESKPWDGRACLALSQVVGVALFARETGARKSLVLQRIAANLSDEPYVDEELGEVSMAWDDPKATASAWLVGCMGTWREFMRQEREKSGT